MPGDLLTQNKVPYLKIVNGQIVQSVDKTTPNAKFREYKLSDGTEGSKWELVYKSWAGVVHDISFKDTPYGEMCQITFDDAILSISTSSRYFSDIAGKLLACDLSLPITISPWDFVTEDGKKKTGATVAQSGDKVGSAFWASGELSPEFPQVDEDKKAKMKANYWKVYFAEVEAFLIEKLTEKAKTISKVPLPDMPEGFEEIEDEYPTNLPFDNN